MFLLKRYLVILTLITSFLNAQGADKYTDENRPYEFGFTIDGEQHRHEKKDENGIIMGEFGFITADGVYHVTVYATDENGNFKILSMKNIRVKPYPTAPVKKGHSIQFPASEQSTPYQNPSSQQQQNAVSIEPPGKSCSHCSLPTTSTRAPQLTDLAVISRNDQRQGYNEAQIGGFGAENPQSYPQGEQNYPQQGNGISQNYNEQNYPQQGSQSGENYPYPGANYPQSGVNYSPQDAQNGQAYPNQGEGVDQNYPQQGNAQYLGQNLEPPYAITSGERNPKQYDENQFGTPVAGQQYNPQDFNGDNYPDSRGQFPNKPTLISAQMQIVDKNTDIYHRSPGEKEGLPPGLTKDDMMLLLYTFNYTVGFHGHHEEGYSNGVKIGYYYVTGRNGIRTRVDYVADDKGFRPKITQEVLDLLSDDVPKPETEKDEKYGLKEYEFKWIYYPKDSK